MKKIAIVGTRGVPAKYGGYETFAEEFAKFSKDSTLLTIYGEKDSSSTNLYGGATLENLPIYKSDSQLKYYWISMFRAAKCHDVILITGTGGGFFIPFIKLIYPNKKFVVNPDGLEFIRTKWSIPVRVLLLLISWASVLFSDLLIADSIGISNYYTKRLPLLKRKFRVIEYGSKLFSYVDSYQSDYYLLVARMVPENNLKMIIKGFLNSNSSKKLYIVSDLPNSRYHQELEMLVRGNGNVELCGPLYDQKKLEEFRCNAFAHFHGHSVGGTNPSLLEAMSAGSAVIAHDNVYNREVLQDGGLFFKSSEDIERLISFVECKEKAWFDEISNFNRSRISKYYNWNRIFTEYILALNFK